MRIAYYIHHTAISAGGIFTYSIGILREILKSPDIENVVVITSKEIADRLDEFKVNSKVKITRVNRKNPLILTRYLISYFLNNIIAAYEISIGSRELLTFFKKISNWSNPYSRILHSEKLALLHVPVQYSPIYKTKIPVIITMHDLQDFHYPKFFTSRERYHRVVNNNNAIYNSDHIIVSFNHVKEDIIKYFNVIEEKISICPPPFADSWFLSKAESNWEELSKKYNLKKNYLLYPAATWQHKNHITLINVLKKLRDDGIEIQLVCTGSKTEYYKKIKSLTDELRLSDVAHFLGIVSEEDLIGLYKNSALVVIPTLYEAGSSPLYEAMRYKVPVICSNVTSLPETINDVEFIFNPLDVNDLANKIKKGLSDSDYRSRNVQNSVNRMVELKQIDIVKNFINVYKKLLN